MACFLVPAAEAVVTTVIEKVLDSEPKATGRRAPVDQAKAMDPPADHTFAVRDHAEAHGEPFVVSQSHAEAPGEHAGFRSHSEAPDEPAGCPSPRKNFARKLRWLNIMLWGGSALLCLEHIWHGEVVPFPPFLTAMPDPVARAEMLHEMATAGVLMAVLITAAWGGMVAISTMIKKRNPAVSREAGE